MIDNTRKPDPSPEEIRQAVELIQEGWSEKDETKRRYVFARPEGWYSRVGPAECFRCGESIPFPSPNAIGLIVCSECDGVNRMADPPPDVALQHDAQYHGFGRVFPNRKDPQR